jgi:acyl-CoA synthetase (AMP-forming)/AMP-acid ligase II
LNLVDNLLAHARTRPTHPALIQGARIVDYAGLASLVTRQAATFAGAGVRQGDVVGTCLEDDIDHVVVLFALAMLGAVILPIDVRWHASEKARVAARFGARFVLLAAGDEIADESKAIHLDDGWRNRLASAEPFEAIARGDSLPLVVSLSSGTSGEPKGPLITHQNMAARFQGHWVSLGFSQHDRFLLTTPLYYGGGRGFSMSYLHAGGTVILFPPPFEPAALVATAHRYQATTAFLVPTQLQRLLELPPAERPLLDGLRLLISSGSALGAGDRRAIRERIQPTFYDYYSSTEGGGISVQTPADQDRYPDAVGQPIYLVDLQVVDDDGRPTAPGTTGRIRYSGPGVATGFHGGDAEPDPTGGAFFRDGWFYPGDLGSLNEAGYLTLSGRAKDLIIRGGVNIYPRDIEAALCTHAHVREAAVVGWPSAVYGEEVAAFVVPQGSEVEAVDLIAHCRAHLSPYKVPAAVFFLDALPITTSGKLSKKDLVARLPRLEADNSDRAGNET